MGFEYPTVLAERLANEERLTDAGFKIDGGGVDMQTGQWDIFVLDDAGDGYQAVLSSAEDVERFIESGGTDAPRRHDGDDDL